MSAPPKEQRAPCPYLLAPRVGVVRGRVVPLNTSSPTRVINPNPAVTASSPLTGHSVAVIAASPTVVVERSPEQPTLNPSPNGQGRLEQPNHFSRGPVLQQGARRRDEYLLSRLGAYRATSTTDSRSGHTTTVPAASSPLVAQAAAPVLVLQSPPRAYPSFETCFPFEAAAEAAAHHANANDSPHRRGTATPPSSQRLPSAERRRGRMTRFLSVADTTISSAATGGTTTAAAAEHDDDFHTAPDMRRGIMTARAEGYVAASPQSPPIAQVSVQQQQGASLGPLLSPRLSYHLGELDFMADDPAYPTAFQMVLRAASLLLASVAEDEEDQFQRYIAAIAGGERRLIAIRDRVATCEAEEAASRAHLIDVVYAQHTLPYTGLFVSVFFEMLKLTTNEAAAFDFMLLLEEVEADEMVRRQRIAMEFMGCGGGPHGRCVHCEHLSSRVRLRVDDQQRAARVAAAGAVFTTDDVRRAVDIAGILKDMAAEAQEEYGEDADHSARHGGSDTATPVSTTDADAAALSEWPASTPDPAGHSAESASATVLGSVNGGKTSHQDRELDDGSSASSDDYLLLSYTVGASGQDPLKKSRHRRRHRKGKGKKKTGDATAGTEAGGNGATSSSRRTSLSLSLGAQQQARRQSLSIVMGSDGAQTMAMGPQRARGSVVSINGGGSRRGSQHDGGHLPSFSSQQQHNQQQGRDDAAFVAEADAMSEMSDVFGGGGGSDGGGAFADSPSAFADSPSAFGGGAFADSPLGSPGMEASLPPLPPRQQRRRDSAGIGAGGGSFMGALESLSSLPSLSQLESPLSTRPRHGVPSAVADAPGRAPRMAAVPEFLGGPSAGGVTRAGDTDLAASPDRTGMVTAGGDGADSPPLSISSTSIQSPMGSTAGRFDHTNAFQNPTMTRTVVATPLAATNSGAGAGAGANGRPQPSAAGDDDLSSDASVSFGSTPSAATTPTAGALGTSGVPGGRAVVGTGGHNLPPNRPSTASPGAGHGSVMSGPPRRGPTAATAAQAPLPTANDGDDTVSFSSVSSASGPRQHQQLSTVVGPPSQPQPAAVFLLSDDNDGEDWAQHRPTTAPPATHTGHAGNASVSGASGDAANASTIPRPPRPPPHPHQHHGQPSAPGGGDFYYRVNPNATGQGGTGTASALDASSSWGRSTSANANNNDSAGAGASGAANDTPHHRPARSQRSGSEDDGSHRLFAAGSTYQMLNYRGSRSDSPSRTDPDLGPIIEESHFHPHHNTRRTTQAVLVHEQQQQAFSLQHPAALQQRHRPPPRGSLAGRSDDTTATTTFSASSPPHAAEDFDDDPDGNESSMSSLSDSSNDDDSEFSAAHSTASGRASSPLATSLSGHRHSPPNSGSTSLLGDSSSRRSPEDRRQRRKARRRAYRHEQMRLAAEQRGITLEAYRAQRRERRRLLRRGHQRKQQPPPTTAEAAAGGAATSTQTAEPAGTGTSRHRGGGLSRARSNAHSVHDNELAALDMATSLAAAEQHPSLSEAFSSASGSPRSQHEVRSDHSSPAEQLQPYGALDAGGTPPNPQDEASSSDDSTKRIYRTSRRGSTSTSSSSSFHPTDSTRNAVAFLLAQQQFGGARPALLDHPPTEPVTPNEVLAQYLRQRLPRSYSYMRPLERVPSSSSSSEGDVNDVQGEEVSLSCTARARSSVFASLQAAHERTVASSTRLEDVFAFDSRMRARREAQQYRVADHDRHDDTLLDAMFVASEMTCRLTNFIDLYYTSEYIEKTYAEIKTFVSAALKVSSAWAQALRNRNAARLKFLGQVMENMQRAVHEHETTDEATAVAEEFLNQELPDDPWEAVIFGEFKGRKLLIAAQASDRQEMNAAFAIRQQHLSQHQASGFAQRSVWRLLEYAEEAETLLTVVRVEGALRIAHYAAAERELRWLRQQGLLVALQTYEEQRRHALTAAALDVAETLARYVGFSLKRFSTAESNEHRRVADGVDRAEHRDRTFIFREEIAARNTQLWSYHALLTALTEGAQGCRHEESMARTLLEAEVAELHARAHACEAEAHSRRLLQMLNISKAAIIAVVTSTLSPSVSMRDPAASGRASLSLRASITGGAGPSSAHSFTPKPPPVPRRDTEEASSTPPLTTTTTPCEITTARGPPSAAPVFVHTGFASEENDDDGHAVQPPLLDALAGSLSVGLDGGGSGFGRAVNTLSNDGTKDLLPHEAQGTTGGGVRAMLRRMSQQPQQASFMGSSQLGGGADHGPSPRYHATASPSVRRISLAFGSVGDFALPSSQRRGTGGPAALAAFAPLASSFQGAPSGPPADVRAEGPKTNTVDEDDDDFDPVAVHQRQEASLRLAREGVTITAQSGRRPSVAAVATSPSTGPTTTVVANSPSLQGGLSPPQNVLGGHGCDRGCAAASLQPPSMSSAQPPPPPLAVFSTLNIDATSPRRAHDRGTATATSPALVTSHRTPTSGDIAGGSGGRSAGLTSRPSFTGGAALRHQHHIHSNPRGIQKGRYAASIQVLTMEVCAQLHFNDMFSLETDELEELLL